MTDEIPYTTYIQYFANIALSLDDFINKRLGAGEYLQIKNADSVQDAIRGFETEKGDMRAAIVDGTVQPAMLKSMAEAGHLVVKAAELESEVQGKIKPECFKVENTDSSVLKTLHNDVFSAAEARYSDLRQATDEHVSNLYGHDDKRILALMEEFTSEEQEAVETFQAFIMSVNTAFSQENLGEVMRLLPHFEHESKAFEQLWENVIAREEEARGTQSKEPFKMTFDAPDKSEVVPVENEGRIKKPQLRIVE